MGTIQSRKYFKYYATCTSSENRKPSPHKEILDSGDNLKFRDFLSVALVINEEDAFPDNWIYIHEPGLKLDVYKIMVAGLHLWSRKEKLAWALNIL